MSKIPFDIKFRHKIESGEYKVETRDGRAARVICWDRKYNNYPIIALFEEYGEECLISYTKNGQLLIGKSNVSDLVIVTPEPEMSEWELAIAKYRPPTDSKETIQRIAAELLDIARKQLQPEIDAMLEDAYNTADEVQYKKGLEEALKNLPRWKKAAQAFGNYTVAPTETGDYCLLIDGYFIMLSDLAKLPKDDSHE